MLAVNYSTIRNNFKEFCDKATDFNETIIITRKQEKNIVLMSLDRYNELERAERNAAYLAKIERGIRQLSEGRGQIHDIIEV